MIKNEDRIKQLANQCVACGLCLLVCPTYQKTSSELDSPRGRIALMKGVSESQIELNDKFKYHIDRCLACGACEAVCPSTVKYLELLDLTRENIPQDHFILKHFNKLNRISRLLPLYPPIFTPSNRFFEPRKKTIDLFLGCVARLFDFKTLRATAKILTLLGYHVRVVSEQTCCGAVYQHAGHADLASKYMQINQKAFESSNTVIFTASGCGSSLKQQLGDKAVDILDFLVNNHLDDLKSMIEQSFEDSTLKRQKIKQIAIHHPCTHKNQLKTTQSTMTLIHLIPEIEFKLLEEDKEYQCCGGAGIYFLTQFELSNQLLEDKHKKINELNPDFIVTTNIGCALQLKRIGKTQIIHPIKLLNLIIK